MHNYCLHDAQANRIKVFNDGLLIEFDHGVYNVDKNGKEINLTDKCKLHISIKGFNSGQSYQHIQIYKCNNTQRVEIELEEFIRLLEKSSYDIDNAYWSSFNNCLLLIGYIEKYNVELFISDIQKISYDFL